MVAPSHASLLAPRSPFAAIAAVAREVLADASVVRWPSRRWESDPAGFAREVLGIELWSAQIEIVESIRDHRNTTVRSGHKCGKSTAIAVAALWFYSTFDRARVIVTAVKASQVENVIWKELRRLFRASQKGPYPLDGEIFEVARSGLRASDERQIFGLTASASEGLAGISSPNVLVLADEASGIKDGFFEVLGTSLASDGGVVRKCYISNPTRTTGEFYRSHTTNKALFNAIHISSEDTPNARGLAKIPGLAGSAWIAEKKIEYGEDSPQYRVRVQGNFAHDAEGKVIGLDLIARGQAAWEEASEDGVVQIGVDPAGDGQGKIKGIVGGDETAIAVRRGSRLAALTTFRGIGTQAIARHVIDAANDNRRARSGVKVRVVIDAGGGIGFRLATVLRSYLETSPDAFDLVTLQGNWDARDHEHDKVRDALWGHAHKWIDDGGGLLDDIKLEQELNCPSWVELKTDKARVTDKLDMRKALGRSPDRADAFCLSVWPCPHLDTLDDRRPSRSEGTGEAEESFETDAYNALDIWGAR